MHSSHSKQSGSIAVLTAVLLPILLGFMALAIDVGYMFVVKSRMQVAADSAALVAANSLNHGQGIDTAYAWALTATAANGFTNGFKSTKVTLSVPPGGTGIYAADLNYFRVTVQDTTPTFFAGIFGVASSLNSASAVAGPTGGGNPCMLTLSTSGSGSLSAVGNASINAIKCGIYVNSTSSSAIKLTGNVDINAGSINVVGGFSKTGDVTTTAVTMGAATTLDPFLSFPKPAFTSCTYTNFSKKGNGSIALTPGTYCGGINLSGNTSVILAPGMYVIYGGGFNVSGNVSPMTGTDVTIYNSGAGATGPNAFGSINLTGDIKLNLSAPLTGSYAGMLFFQNPLNTQAASLGGNSGSTFKGNLYFPKNSLTLSGNSGTTIPMGAIVAQNVNVTGNATISMTNTYGASGSTLQRSALYE